mmetsp:Transcript_56184/g.93358  ORF Transcript_56184/g.93358 Transcript_56184/m.93358 type:complete len:211 (-) Transcript_56184:766-1398(-)
MLRLCLVILHHLRTDVPFLLQLRILLLQHCHLAAGLVQLLGHLRQFLLKVGLMCGAGGRLLPQLIGQAADHHPGLVVAFLQICGVLLGTQLLMHSADLLLQPMGLLLLPRDLLLQLRYALLRLRLPRGLLLRVVLLQLLGLGLGLLLLQSLSLLRLLLELLLHLEHLLLVLVLLQLQLRDLLLQLLVVLPQCFDRCTQMLCISVRHRLQT